MSFNGFRNVTRVFAKAAALIDTPRGALIAAFIAVAAGFALRAAFITAESPYGLCSYMSPWADEAGYTFTVKELLLHGEKPETADEAYYYFLKNTPAFQMICLAFCRFAGLGYAQIRLLSVLFNTAAAGVLFLLLRRYAVRPIAVAAVLLLSVNYLGIMYGRLALTHSLAVPLFVFTAYCWLRARESPWWAAAAGALWCVTYFNNQLGIIFIVILGTWWLTFLPGGNRKRLLMMWAAFTAGIAVCGAVMLWTYFYDLALKDVYEFLVFNFTKRRNTGSSPSPAAILAGLINPAQMLFFDRLPVITTAAFLGAAVWMRRMFAAPAVHLRDVEALMVIWCGLHLLFLAVFGYRPIRYHYYLLPPMAVLAASFVAALLRPGVFVVLPAGRRGYHAAAVLGAALLFCHFIVSHWLRSGGYGSPALPPLVALGVTAGIVLLPRLERTGTAFRASAAAAVIAAVLAVNLKPYADWVGGRRYRTVESGRGMAAAVNDKAVIGMLGSLSNAFGLESHLKEVSYWNKPNGAGYSVKAMFRAKDVTHMLMRRDKKDYHDAWRKAFPGMYRDKLLVGTYYYKTFAVDLFRVRHPFRTVPYRPTAFERARELEDGGKRNDAIATYREHLARAPRHAEAWYRAGMLTAARDPGRAAADLRRAADLLPRSYLVRRNLGALLLATRDRSGALAVWKKALRLFPHDRTLAADVRRLEQGLDVKPRLYRGSPYL